jgi:putative transposase
MASPRVSLVLALEIQAGRQARSAQEPPRADPEDGGWESYLGRRTHRQRVEVETGHKDFIPYGAEVSGQLSGRTPDPSQRWLTFVHDHAQFMVACDFFVVFTARFRILYILVIMELGRCWILHHNVTAHPSAEWTLQQFREALTPTVFWFTTGDSIFSKDLDKAVIGMGVRILKTPVRAPKANAVCERLVGTIRRECLDFLIPCGEQHLKQLLTQWVAHYNHARVHTSLGLGVPDPIRPSPPMSSDRHHFPAGHVLRSKAVLGGLRHEYWLEKVAAWGSNQVFADDKWV